MQQLGELRWSLEQIAAFYGWDIRSLEAEMRDPSSEVRKALLRGELKSTFEIETKLLSDAKTGNQTSAKVFSDLIRERSFKLTKLDLFGGSEDSILFEHVQQFLEKGSSDKIGADEQLYIQALQMVYSFQVRFGDRKTIRLLTRDPFKLSYDRAKDMLTEAIELFNSGRRNTKQAMRYHIAESYDTLYHAILETAKTPQDFAIAAGILDKKAKLLQLDQPEVEDITPELYPRKFIITSLTPEAIGLPSINRDELANQIKSLGLPGAENDRVEMEAGIRDFDIIKALEHADTEES